MNAELARARDFMASHARLLDRARFELLNDGGDPGAVLAALGAYSNPDGGYGWGLEADLRAPESQPGAAHHAFEVFEEITPATTERAVALCDWLDSITLSDGGLPFALPLSVTAGSAPWWTGADSTVSSLQITSITASGALRVAARDAAVAAHPWLERATDYCLRAIENLGDDPFAYVLAFSIRFLDALHDQSPEQANSPLSRLAKFVPPDGKIAVHGGAEGETLHPLDIAPDPGRPARALFTDDVIAADLERLAGLQQEDGGWIVDFHSASPRGALDWRGYKTVSAIDVLRRNGAAP